MAAAVSAELFHKTVGGKAALDAMASRWFAEGSGLKSATRKSADRKTPVHLFFLTRWFDFGVGDVQGIKMTPERAYELFQSMRNPEDPTQPMFDDLPDNAFGCLLSVAQIKQYFAGRASSRKNAGVAKAAEPISGDSGITALPKMKKGIVGKLALWNLVTVQQLSALTDARIDTISACADKSKRVGKATLRKWVRIAKEALPVVIGAVPVVAVPGIVAPSAPIAPAAAVIVAVPVVAPHVSNMTNIALQAAVAAVAAAVGRGRAVR